MAAPNLIPDASFSVARAVEVPGVPGVWLDLASYRVQLVDVDGNVIEGRQLYTGDPWIALVEAAYPAKKTEAEAVKASDPVVAECTAPTSVEDRLADLEKRIAKLEVK